MPCGAVGGRELIPRAKGAGMVRAADSLIVTDRPAEDGERVLELVRGHQGMAETALGPDGVGMIRSKRADPVHQDPLKPWNGLRRLPGRQVCVGQPLADRQRVRVVRREDPVD